jgi:hypothetical protein
MNAYTTRIMVTDHIREFRGQAASAHRADHARADQRKPARHVARRGLGRLLHSA